MSTEKKAIFARLSKVDEAKKTVTGVMASSEVDGAGESFDYASSKPYVEAWSADVAKASGGKSIGNVRAMHGMNAVGKVLDMMFDDAAESITITANIVDEAEFAKCLAGVYTGFSVGGDYVKKWDENGVKKYTANVGEVSIVDMPCNPGATFQVIKAAGGVESHEFVKAAGTGAEDDANSPRETEAKPSPVPAALDIGVLSKVSGVDLSTNAAWLSGQPVDRVLKAVALARRQHVEDVATLVKASTEMAAFLEGKEPDLKKYLFDVCQLVETFSMLETATWYATSDRAAEGDMSKVPEQLKGALVLTGQALIDLAAEEVAELLAMYGVAMGDVPEAVVETESPEAAIAEAAGTLDGGEKPEGESGAGMPENVDTPDPDAAEDDDAAEKSIKTTMRKVMGVPEKFNGSLTKFAADKLRKMQTTIDEFSRALAKAKAHNGVVIAERDELRKSLGALKTEHATLLAKAAPLPGNAPKLLAVGKGEDDTALTKALPEGVDPVKDSAGNTEPVASLIKAAHAAGPSSVHR